MRLYILTLLTLCAAASPAAAQTSYAPGTVGYLYEDCRAALQSETADGFINSHCFNFGVGYGFGGLGANWIVPTVKKDDPCQADKNRLYTHLQERFCGNVLKPPPSVIQNPVLTTLHMFFGWVDHLKENGQDDVLQQSVTTALNAMITPGPFCATIDAYAGEKFPYDISPAVRKFATSLLSVRKEVMARTYAAGYEQCKADTAAPDQFRASNCGAEILGYITGINSTRWIQDNRLTATDESCAPAMAR
ncbi:MAG: hypothetical protein KJ667_00420, partial [Alphaproteobacteria bacterium]|nr:hypothetical protein [Alphaproteobacteria bacterium]